MFTDADIGRIYIARRVEPEYRKYFNEGDKIVLLQEDHESIGPLVSNCPPFASLDACIKNKIDVRAERLLNHEKLCDAGTCYLYMSEDDVIETTEVFNMSEFADDIFKTLEDVISAPLEEITAIAEDDPVEPVSIPEGHKAYVDVFGYEPAQDTSVCFPNHPEAPALPQGWVFPRKETEDVMHAIASGLSVRLVGPPTTGKSDLVEAIAAVTQRPFLRISCHENMLPEDLLGKMNIQEGDTKFVHGLLPRYWIMPSLIVFDEVSRLPRGTACGILQRCLEPARILPIIENNEFIQAHPDLVIMATDNTLGLGDNMDKYAAHVQDISTLTRWNCTILMDYMLADEFAGILSGKVPAFSKAHAKKMATFAALCQNAYSEGSISLPFGLRQAVPTAVLSLKLKSVSHALRMTYTNSLYGEEKAAVEGFIKTVWA